MGLQFHETVRGARFFDHTLPTLIKSINRLADAVEESNRLQHVAAISNAPSCDAPDNNADKIFQN